MKKFFFWILLFLFPLSLYLIVDLCLTKFFFSELKKKPSIEKKTKQKKYWRIKHDVFHHTFLPNVDVIDKNDKFGSHRFVTNSMGFRDSNVREIPYNKKNYRIIFIGDSFTEGLLLNYEDTFVGIIDKNFNKKNIEVLNAGKSSYSPSIYYTKIKYLIDKNFSFDELIVYIDISDIEDEALNYRVINNRVVSLLDKKRKQKKKDPKRELIFFLKDNFYITYWVLNLIHDKTILTLNKNYTQDEFLEYIFSDKFVRDKWTLNKKIEKKYILGIENSIKYMQLLAELCNENNINLSIAVYPWPSQIFYNDLDSKHVTMWKNFSTSNNLQFINHFPIFFKDINKSSDLKDHINKYYIEHDIHFNHRGNKIIAHDFLKKYKLKF